MKTKLDLIHILVNDEALIYPYREFTTKHAFSRYLRHNNLLWISSIWILFRLKKGNVLQIEIRKARAVKHWRVYNMNKFFFAFDCEDRKTFMKTFEQGLNEKLSKIDLLRTKPPKGKH